MHRRSECKMGPSTRSKEQAEEKKRRKEKENKMTLSKFISKKRHPSRAASLLAYGPSCVWRLYCAAAIERLI